MSMTRWDYSRAKSNYHFDSKLNEDGADWRHSPHGTANISRSLRATLQVTGLVTEQTRRIIDSGLSLAQRLPLGVA